MGSKRFQCCFEGCHKEAAYMIFDTMETRYDLAETHSCVLHVGKLIGSVPPTDPTGPWTIYVIDKETA